LIVNGTQGRFSAGVLVFDIFDGGGEIFFGGVFFPALAFRAFGNPPGGVRAELVLGFEPGATGVIILGTIFFEKGNPFIERTAGTGFKVGYPFLDLGHAGVDVVKRCGLGGGFGHGASWERQKDLRGGSVAEARGKRKKNGGRGIRRAEKNKLEKKTGEKESMGRLKVGAPIPPLRNGKRRRCFGRDDKTREGKPKTHTQNRRVGHPALERESPPFA